MQSEELLHFQGITNYRVKTFDFFFFQIKSFTEQWKDIACRISEQYKQRISVLFSLDNDLFC